MGIKELRLRRKLSQRKLAKLTGIPQSTLSDLENGLAEPKPAQAEALARALGADCGDLRR